MDWVKLAVRYYTDPKVRGLDDAAELMFVRGLARAGELGSRGFIPEADLGLLTRRRRWGSLVRALVDAGLWSPVSGGYVVERWAEWNSAADALAARRQADRERQRKHRQKDEAPCDDPDEVSRDGQADDQGERERDPPDVAVSRDIGSVSRDVTHARGKTERTTYPPNPPPDGGGDDGHHGQHANCRACGTNPRGKPPPPEPEPEPSPSPWLPSEDGTRSHLEDLAGVERPPPETVRDALAEAREAMRRRGRAS